MRFVFQSQIKPKKNSPIITGSFDYAKKKYVPKYISNRKGARSQKNLRQEAWEQRLEQKGKMFTVPVRVTAIFRKTPADCIGLMETVLDALETVAYKNDRQAHEQSSRWDAEGLLKPYETGIVTVEPLGSNQPVKNELV